MNKKKIQEVIVVEGYHDTARLKEFYDCETIETHGTCLSEWTLRFIKNAAKKKGIIVFTDPDGAGNRIRRAVNEAVPGCKNAYVNYEDAVTPHKVGVEHASFEAIDAALSHLVTYASETETITVEDMVDLGLTGQPDSKQKRDKVGRIFHLGNANAKTMRSRLNALGITKKEIEEVL